MKMRLLVFVTAALFISPLVVAQEQGDMRAGIGLAYGTKANVQGNGAIGITPSFEYVFADAMSGNLSYDYFFKSETTILGTTFSSRLSSFNLDYRYYFSTEGTAAFYGMAGLAFMSVKTESSDPILGSILSGTFTDTRLQFGGGANIGLSESMALNTQLKYTFGIEQLVINAGLTFMF